MGCVVSTEPDHVDFSLDAPWALSAQVAVRPERFGALLYHFGSRRLSFLKSPALLRVVTALAEQPSARAACTQAGIAAEEMAQYTKTLAALAATDMIQPRLVG